MNQLQKTVELARAVLEDNRGAISNLYHWYREQVLSKLKGRFLKEEEADLEDAFHQALLKVIEKFIKNGIVVIKNDTIENLELLNATAMIYLMAKTIVLKMIRARERQNYVPFEDYLNVAFEEENLTEEERASENERAMNAFGQLRPLCQDLISSRLVHGFRFGEIVELLAEEGEQVLRKQEAVKKAVTQRRQENFRCIRQLRKYYRALRAS